MNYEWDEEKRQRNIEERGIDFEDVPALFDSTIVVMEDDRYEYGEVRWVAFGILQGIVMAVVYTEREGETIRVISVRKATKRERREYYAQIAN